MGPGFQGHPGPRGTREPMARFLSAGNTGSGQLATKRIISASSRVPIKQRRRAAGEKLRTFGAPADTSKLATAPQAAVTDVRLPLGNLFSNPTPCSHPNPDILPTGDGFRKPRLPFLTRLKGRKYGRTAAAEASYQQRVSRQLNGEGTSRSQLPIWPFPRINLP
jgi:hypothetical protein